MEKKGLVAIVTWAHARPNSQSQRMDSVCLYVWLLLHSKRKHPLNKLVLLEVGGGRQTSAVRYGSSIKAKHGLVAECVVIAWN